MLNPYAAKRLWILVGAILKQYESRFGTLNIDISGNQPGTAGAASAAAEGSAGGDAGEPKAKSS